MGKGKLMLVGLLLLTIGVSVNAQRPRWIFVATTSDEATRFYWRADTLVRSGTFVRVWEQSVNEDGKMIVLSQYDCERGRNRVLQVTSYTSDGNVDQSIDLPGRWSYVVPDSVGEILLRRACTVPSRPLVVSQ
jgi:hypothetical protein